MSKYKTMLKILMATMFTPGPVDNDWMYEVILRFAKKERWVKLHKRLDRYYLTEKGYKNIKKYMGGDDDATHK